MSVQPKGRGGERNTKANQGRDDIKLKKKIVQVLKAGRKKL